MRRRAGRRCGSNPTAASSCSPGRRTIAATARAVAENWLLGKLAWAESDLENAAADDAELGAAVASDASLNSEVFTELVLTVVLLIATVPDVLAMQNWVHADWIWLHGSRLVADSVPKDCRA